MKKITIITGHYGSGKTNLSANLAMKLAGEGKSVCVADLDIVNPYFRTADFKQLFEDNKIKLVAPEYANSNLDIPALNFDLEQLILEYDYLIIDVGGDDAGAVALGRYADSLEKYISEIDMFYVINAYRYLTRTSQEAFELMNQIETASRMKHTAIVNNSNLGSETTLETVENSLEFASETAMKAGIPLIYTTCREDLAEFSEIEDLMPVKVYVTPFWER